MRIIHTADLHLDTCFAGSGMPAGFGNRRRQSLRDVLEAIIQRARTWPADALLIAGDLFEHERVSRDTVAFLVSRFASIPNVPVFIAPGNHDPYVEGSPYVTAEWPENVTIFSKPDWVAHGLKDRQLTVHGFGFDGPQISRNPFGSLRINDEGAQGVHVAVAHGSERSHQPPGKDVYAPFDAAQAAPRGLAYLALGHFHATTSIEGDFDTVVYYAGAPEGFGFNETGLHHFLEVEIVGGEVHIDPVPASRLVYATHTVACDGFASSQDIVEAIRRLTEDEGLPLAARVTLNGACAPDVQSEFGAVCDALGPQFEHLELVDATSPMEDYQELAGEETCLGAFTEALNQEMADATEEARLELLERAREVGVAAFRLRDLDIRGLRQS